MSGTNTTLNVKRNELLKLLVSILQEGGSSSVETTHVHTTTTGSGSVTAGAKAVTFVWFGDNVEIGGLNYPTAGSITYEYNDDLHPAIAYDAGGVQLNIIEIR